MHRVYKTVFASFLMLLLGTVAVWSLNSPGEVTATVIENDSVVLNWRGVEGAEKYLVYRMRGNEKDTFGVVGRTSDNTWTDRKVSVNHTYLYYVQAQSKRSVSDNSEIVSVTIGAGQSRTKDKNRRSDQRTSESYTQKSTYYGVTLNSQWLIAFRWNTDSGKLEKVDCPENIWRQWEHIGDIPRPDSIHPQCPPAFSAADNDFRIWLWNPVDGKVQFLKMNFLGGNTPTWQVFPFRLDSPPNWSRQALMMVDSVMVKKDFYHIYFACFDPLSKSTWFTYHDGTSFRQWFQWGGGLENPPNSGKECFLSFGIRVLKGSSTWAFYAFNPTESRLFQTVRFDNSTDWTEWMQLPQVFGH